MKKRIASISMAAALILSSLSTAGMSVFASEADAPTTAATVVSTTAADETTTASTTATTETSASTTASKYTAPNYKEIVGDIAGKVVSKVIANKTTTAAATTTTTTTAAADEITTADSAETTTAASAETTTAADATTTTTAQSVPVTPVKPASPNFKAIAEKIITKILSKKYSQVTVANKNLTVSRGHYTMVRATGKGKISYFSLNKKVATVDKYGIVKGVSQGSTRIRVIAWGNSEYYPSSTYVTVKVTPSWSDIFAPLFK
ncbi:MAG: hypothetical protein PUB37_06255 [Firmicutes bacterium]|nr:hypothetical protein [Bacillota bacterium]